MLGLKPVKPEVCAIAAEAANVERNVKLYAAHGMCVRVSGWPHPPDVADGQVGNQLASAGHHWGT
jgi:hypothetical protein